MADWLMEIAERKRRSELEDKNARPAPWEGRTRAELIYGGPVIDEPPSWSYDGPPVVWEPLADGSHKVTLREAAAPAAPSQPQAETATPHNSASLSGGGGDAATGEVVQSEGVTSPAKPDETAHLADAKSLGNGGAKIFAIDTRKINQTPGEQDTGKITLVNDVNNGRVLDREIDSRLAGLIEAYVAEYGRSVNVNSTIRDWEGESESSLHYKGHGVDVNMIDGKPVKPGDPLVKEFVDFLKSRPESLQILGPDEAVIRENGQFVKKSKYLKDHDDHVHIGTDVNWR